MGQASSALVEVINWVFLKRHIPLTIKKRLLPFLYPRSMKLPDGRRNFVFLAADYGNIGDLAITAAQKNFLRNHFPERQLVTVPISATIQLLRSIQAQINQHDLVTIIGGGNMGSLYPDIEQLRQLVIRSFPHNRIICFPQTLDWDESVISERALRQIVRTYSRHPDIHVFAREAITRDMLSKLFHGHGNVIIGYVPDIVMSATAGALGAKFDAAPSGILRCLRDDRECALDSECYAQLDAALASTGHLITQTDTHAGGSQLDDSQCAQLLAGKLEQFRGARLVVTDRLHGMILSVLAGTPCLVLPNANHKIRQTWFDWLQENPGVAFLELDHFDTLSQVLGRLLEVPRGSLQTPPIDGCHYAGLQDALIRS